MDIREMKAGRELDTLVGKAIGAVPNTQWYCMNKEETAYCISFERESMARDWHSERIAKYPNSWYAEDGYHVVREEIYRQYSEDMAEAWKVVEKQCIFPFSLMKDESGTWAVNWCRKNYECFNCDEECQGEYEIEAETAPLAICRAALLALEDK